MMTGEELLIDTLCDAWRQALESMHKTRKSDPPMHYYWLGVMNGIACSIAAVSGIPEKIGFMATVQAGSDIARARLR